MTTGAGVAQSVYCLSTDWVTDVPSPLRQKILPLTSVSRPVLRPTQHPVQLIQGVVSRGKAWPGRDADHLVPSSAEVKNE
jgi:hypothetical protein